MARRLQSLSSLALNNINLDSETDYDSDDVEATRLRINDEGMMIDGARPTDLHLPEFDSSDAESLADIADGSSRQKAHRRRKKPSARHGIDLDKTPTQDSVNGAFFGKENGEMSASITEPGVHREDADIQLTNGAKASKCCVEKLSISMDRVPVDDGV